MTTNTFDKFIHIHEHKSINRDINKLEKQIELIYDKSEFLDGDLRSSIDKMIDGLDEIKNMVIKYSVDNGI